jgi:hypothetical protein
MKILSPRRQGAKNIEKNRHFGFDFATAEKMDSGF